MLFEALKPIADNAYIDDDGMWCTDVTLEARLAGPLNRALMRAEAALLLHDADRLGTPGYEDRTPPQRRADALVELVQMMSAAVQLTRLSDAS